jgi:hypothetical protein
MATIQDVIDSARYDLRDYEDGLAFDDTELVLFVNRMIRNIDSALAAVSSDLVFESASITLATASNEVDVDTTLNSGKWDSIRALWNSQTKIYKMPVQNLFYERLMVGTATGAPWYWAMQGRTIQFDRTSDQEYTLTCWYNTTTGTVTVATTTPYSGVFDDWIREMLVLHAKGKKTQNLKGAQGDLMYQELARKRVMEIVIRRNFIPKSYYIDF